jgi:hypothetical protein
MLKHLDLKLQEPSYINSLRDVFIRTYFQGGHYAIAARVPMHAALIHLKRACKRFRYQDESGWQETILHQIDEGAMCMDRMGVQPQSTAEIAELYDECPATV